MTARQRILGVLLIGPALLVAGAPAASAHPLGNFTVNHYDGLTLYPDRVDDLAVVDLAEIPTLQERRTVDADGDDRVDDAERARHAARSCTALATAIDARAGTQVLRWRVLSSAFDYRSGAAGLDVSRLECRLSAPARLDRDTRLAFTDGFGADRIGWHEITATGRGVQLQASPVPERSVSNELRAYPDDLLSSPLDVRSAVLSLRPGGGVSTSAGAIDLPVAGPLARWLNVLSGHFTELVGARTLTPAVGLLAVLLSLLLGASHALLPGHGKTVIAAYLAGRRGSARDALTVGATVTVTHTAGVIVLGLLLSGVAALAGETVLGYLGVASGLLIAVIGGWLLASALRPGARRVIVLPDEPPTVVDLDPPVPGDGPAGSAGARVVTPLVGVVAVNRLIGAVPVDGLTSAIAVRLPAPGPTAPNGHDHGADAGAVVGLSGPGVGHGHGHGHGHAHGHGLSLRTRPAGNHGPLGRATLIGMGIAGGLVPSPSALVVLLGAIGLGRTWFGILLVIGYGIGMAAVLTAVGLLLVRLRSRLDDATMHRFSSGSHRLARLTPVLTATLVLLVGLGLTARAAAPLL